MADWDILVVGAGPAGASAALEATKAGRSVLLIDAKRRAGADCHCAEYVPRRLALEMDFPERSVAWPVSAMETRLDDESIITPAPGFILDRTRFDAGLVESAAAAGAEIQVQTRFIGLEDQDWILRSPRGETRLRPRAVVAADGAASRVRRLLGFSPPRLLTGAQIRVP